MAPAPKTRESLNINEILDTTGPDKLIQFIRAKSNRPVNKNIFCDLSRSNRGSFPIQVEFKKPVKVAKKAPADASSDSSRDSSSDDDFQEYENTPKIANKNRSPSKVNTNDRKKVEDKQRSNKKSMLPRPFAKMPPNLVARRALGKTFNDIHNGVSFLPSAASTPVQRSIPDDPFGSAISNINANSSENTEENILAGKSQPEIERNTEIPAKPNDDILSNRTPDQIAAQPQRRVTLNRTHVLNESMELEESRSGHKSSRLSLVQPNKNKTIQHEDNQIEETLVNSVSQYATLKGSAQHAIENNPPHGSNDNEQPAEEETLIDVPINSPNPVQQHRENLTTKESRKIQDNAIRQSTDRQSIDSRRQSVDSRRQSIDSHRQSTNHSNHVPNHHRSISRRLSQASVRSQDPPNAHQTTLNRSSNVKSLDNIISAMVAKVRKSFEQQPILAPPTPFRSDHPPNPRDESITIPPTQSQPIPVNCPTSSMVIIPMFAPGHCNQTQSKTHLENPHVEQTQNGSQAYVNFDPVSHLGNENRRSILQSKRQSEEKRAHSRVSFPSDDAQIRSPSTSPTKMQQHQSAEINATSNKSKNVASSSKDGGNTVHRASLSSKTIQRRTENESRARLYQIEPKRLTAYENSHTSRHSRLLINGKKIDHSLLEFQVTSDESNNISGPTSKQNTGNANFRESEGLLVSNAPIEAIDLRLSCRRSMNFKESPHTVQDSQLVGNKLSLHSLSSTSRMSDKTGNSDSTEVSISGILRLDEMLKKLNNASGEKSTESPIVSRNESPPPRCVDTSTNTRINGMLEEFNEDILEPARAKAATHGGYVYDMSPQTGKRWMNSFIKNRPKARTLAGSKRGRRVISSNSPSSHAVTYNDIEFSMLRRNKSKSISRRISQQRRLYSKGNSMEEFSSDEDESKRNNTTILNLSSKSHRLTCDQKTKNFKPAKPPVPMKFYTIKERVENWGFAALPKPNYDQAAEHHDQFALQANTDDDENLFKVPQPLSMKRKIVPQKILNFKRQKINVMMAVPRPERSQTAGLSNDDSGHSSSSISTIRSSRSTHTQTTDETTPCKTKAVIQTREIDASRKLQKRQQNNSQYQENSYQSEKRELSRPLPYQGDSHESAVERPAEPEVTNDIDSSYAVISRKTNTPKSAKIRNKSKIMSSKNDSIVRDMISKDWASDNDRLSSANIEHIENAEHPGILSEKPAASPSKDRHTNKEANSSLLSKTKSNRGTEKKSKTKKSPKISCISSPKSISNSDTTTGSLLRRSSRKRAPPKPYWTFRQDEYELPMVLYKDKVVRKKGTKRKQKKTQLNLEAIAEQSHMQAPIQSSEVLPDADNPPSSSALETSDQADELFQAIKEMSMNNGRMIQPTTSKSKKKIARRQPPKKPTSQSESDATTNGNERTILTDSGMSTDTNNRPERTNGDFLLSWLKNLIEPTKISSNPDLSRILRESAITVVPAQSLEFHSIDGIDYAYYSSGGSGNYGYMRFHPQVTKPAQRLKRYELRLLNIFGVLHMKTEKGVLALRNGDFVTVPKGERYAIANKTDKNALLFYIKVETT